MKAIARDVAVGACEWVAVQVPGAARQCERAVDDVDRGLADEDLGALGLREQTGCGAAPSRSRSAHGRRRRCRSRRCRGRRRQAPSCKKILRPETIQPVSVRFAVVLGRVRSCLGSLPAEAKTVPFRAISSRVSPYARARRSSPAALAICQRRATLSTKTRCMFTPRVSAAAAGALRDVHGGIR
jgi:hypothetical protein